MKNETMQVTKQEKRHFFELGKPAQEVSIFYKDQEVAKTTKAFLLKELGKQIYDQVYYIPREDVNMEMFEINTNSSFCPIKGEASYFDLKYENEHVENIAWSYEKPLPRAGRISEYLAFYPNQVTFKLSPLGN